VEHHKGQISFPGGARDEDDGSIVETALRETREEIGLTPDHIQVLGIFDDLPTHTGFLITPVVGFIPLVPKLKPNSTEVSEIFDVPFSLFTDKRNETRKKIERNGIVREAYFYYHGTHEIWGITAAIIRSFVDALQNANSPRTGRLRSGRR
jgi:8-oxo-dGTP pyrophosphatase MutT (NUDIX family)